MLEVFPEAGGGGGGSFYVHMFTCIDDNVKFSSLQGLSVKRLDTQTWLDFICVCAVHCFLWWRLSSASADSAAMKPRVSCNISFVSVLNVFYLCYSIYEFEMQKFYIFHDKLS